MIQSFRISAAILLLVAFPLAARGSEPAIDAAFRGGNIVVERIEGDRIDLHQDLRDTEGSWFYWYFRVRGAAGRSFTFHFTRGDAIGVRGPVVSSDGGKTWQWLGTKSATRNSFRYTFGPDGEVRFCVAIPYRVLQQVQTGPLVYDPQNNLPHGVGWNNLQEPRSFGRWAAMLPGMRMASSLEVPYADAADQPVTPDSARALGRDLARAIRVYLEQRQ